MKTTSLDSLILTLVLALNRISFGLFLLGAGLMKWQTGITHFYRKDFLGLKPDWLPEAVAKPYGYALPSLEIIVGGLITLGLFTRTATALAGLLVASFTIACISKAGTLRATFAEPFHHNYILITLTLLLIVIGPGRLSVDGVRCTKRRIKQV